eukprot:UN14712
MLINTCIIIVFIIPMIFANTWIRFSSNHFSFEKEQLLLTVMRSIIKYLMSL